MVTDFLPTQRRTNNFASHSLKHLRKEKWDSSGANEAVSNFSASIPESTKDYISQTTGQLFSRDRLRTVSVCFGIGEERPFYVERTPSLLIARVKHNLQFFYLNYLLMVFVLFCLTLFISPSAIIGMALLAGAWVYVIKATQSGSLKLGGEYFNSPNKITSSINIFGFCNRKTGGENHHRIEYLADTPCLFFLIIHFCILYSN